MQTKPKNFGLTKPFPVFTLTENGHARPCFQLQNYAKQAARDFARYEKKC